MSLCNDKVPYLMYHLVYVLIDMLCSPLCEVGFQGLCASVRAPTSDMGSNSDTCVTSDFSNLTFFMCKMGITALLAFKVVGRCLQDQVR